MHIIFVEDNLSFNNCYFYQFSVYWKQHIKSRFIKEKKDNSINKVLKNSLVFSPQKNLLLGCNSKKLFKKIIKYRQYYQKH